MVRGALKAAFAAFVTCSAVALAAVAHAAEPSVERGRQVYELGLGASGEPIRATSAAGVELVGADAACTHCHRRSGMGSREGRLVIPPVAAPILFAPGRSAMPERAGREPPRIEPLRHESRDAYDDERLVKALRHGMDSSGRALDALMPRYALHEDDEAALLAYLHRLGRDAEPAVDRGTLRLATLITPDAEPHRAQVVERAMRAWARSGALGGLPIELQVWRLTGPASAWDEQLQGLLRRDRPFAVLSGAGGAQWRPVRDFCERSALPCLFPVVDYAPDDGADAYNVYFSRGVPLEARLLAAHIREQAGVTRVLQWIDETRGTAGREAAERLKAELGAGYEVSVQRFDALEDDMAAMPPAADVVVAWLGTDALRRMVERLPEALHGVPVFLSSRLAPPAEVALPTAWRRDAAWVSAGSDPARLHGKGVLGLLPWTQQLGIPLDDEALLSEVYAATYFFGDALARMRGPWSRDWLIETIEASHFTRPAGAAFFSLSLGPGQREAAKAGHLLRYTDGAILSAEGPLLQPWR